jgi:pantoate--beta-alanine ligase
MVQRIRTIRTLARLRRATAHFRDKGETLALVPTMGALHNGHFSLIRRAQGRADRVAVSIFVNPAQFAPHEDLAAYPRTFAADIAALSRLAVDLVWAPDVAQMYPEGFATRVAPEGAAVAGLEDKFRAHFFGGVATVVAKLLLQCQPDIAVFGEKDYQQLKVVTQMTRDLNIPVQVIGAPTVREKDGLALSSRNAYLSAAERAVAPTLHAVLTDCAKRIRQGEPVARVLAAGREAISHAGFAVDYLEARHAETLQPIQSPAAGPIRLLVAAKIGTTRLIDNAPV